jgi:hypothetical protein
MSPCSAADSLEKSSEGEMPVPLVPTPDERQKTLPEFSRRPKAGVFEVTLTQNGGKKAQFD